MYWPPFFADFYAGGMEVSFVRSMITLVYKDRGSRSGLANYRPISLLNTDYKTLAKVLSFRMKSVTGMIVGLAQPYSISGRDITDCIPTMAPSCTRTFLGTKQTCMV